MPKNRTAQMTHRNLPDQYRRIPALALICRMVSMVVRNHTSSRRIRIGNHDFSDNPVQIVASRNELPEGPARGWKRIELLHAQPVNLIGSPEISELLL